MFKLTALFKVILFLSLIIPGVLMAEDDPCKEAKEELVKKGIVASVGTYSGATAIQSHTGGAAPGEESSVLVGSIRSLEEGKCVAAVVNTSECKSYNVSFTIKSAPFGKQTWRSEKYSSAKLSPKGTKEVSFPCNKAEKNYVVEIVSVR